MNTKFTIESYVAPYTYPGAIDYTFDCMSIADESKRQAALIPMDNPNWEKHLKLIAAAPELLETLENALGVCQAFATQSITARQCAELAEAAIKKATE